jgi:transposase
VNSPYDTEARYGKKRGATWVGYTVHLTAACEEGTPHLITQVETTPAGVNDDRMTTPIHHALQTQGLLPHEHLVDTGYVDAELLVQSREQFSVDLVGPTRKDYKGQRQAQHGFAAAQFVIDWRDQTATCPLGKTSSSWTPAVDKWQNRVLKSNFSARDCGICPSRPLCATATRHRHSPPPLATTGLP